jgi:mannitol-1-phosphate 5-dehydrogenase
MQTAVQFGAGNIGRGFMGQLLWEAGYRTIFVESSRDLVSSLNENGQYPLKLLDASSKKEINLTINRVQAVGVDDLDAAARAVNDAQVIGTAVGVKNLEAIAPVLSAGLEKRFRSGRGPVDIYLCENLVNAAEILRDEVMRLTGESRVRGYIEENVGFTGTVVARMVPPAGRYAGAHPLLVVADSYHRFPYDGQAVKAVQPPIDGMYPVENFKAEVERKLYTYNLGHAALAYLGHLKNYTYVHEPFADAQLMKIFQGALDETCGAIVSKYPDVFTPADNREIRADIDLRFGNPMIQDTVHRVGRDPVRKLGPGDRLVGSGRLCLEQGVFPEHIASVCGAALRYDYSGDADAVRLQEMIASKGAGETLRAVSDLDPESEFGRKIIESYRVMAR